MAPRPVTQGCHDVREIVPVHPPAAPMHPLPLPLPPASPPVSLRSETDLATGFLLVRYSPPGPPAVVEEQVARYAAALFPYDATWLGGTAVALSPPVASADAVAAALRARVGDGVEVRAVAMPQSVDSAAG